VHTNHSVFFAEWLLCTRFQNKFDGLTLQENQHPLSRRTLCMLSLALESSSRRLHPAAWERRGNKFKDFYLKVHARIWH